MFENKKPPAWLRLDNAAKIFPSTGKKSDTNVFRFACILKQAVEPETLQKALEQTLRLFPSFSSVLRRGLFWYYLELGEVSVQVHEECEAPCASLYDATKHGALFRVTYWGCRINLEIYHVLADGTGAMQFLQNLVTAYLALKEPSLAGVMPSGTPVMERGRDGFQKYYEKPQEKNTMLNTRAFRLHGDKREDNRVQVIEGIASTKAVLDAAHRHNATLTVYLTALLFCAIHETMYRTDEKRDVVISVPVNLRPYFPSETARNFFCLMDVRYNFQKSGDAFEDILHAVAKEFEAALNPEALRRRMNSFASLERNPFVRIAPLVLKDPVLRISRGLSDRCATMVISNVGRMIMPPETQPYIEYFSVLTGTYDMQICMCSFGENLQLGFTSAYTDTAVQREFFTALTKQGVPVKILTNEFGAQAPGEGE